MGRRASYNCRLSIKQAIGKWILAFSLYYNSSVIKFDNQHDASTASTKAKLSAAIVLLTIQWIFLDCHIIRDKFPKESCKNMQKPPCEPPFSKLLYEAIYNYIQHHYIQLVYTVLRFPYKESDLIWAFFSTLFALKMCSTVA